MVTSLDSIISGLKGHFGGTRRTPEQKIEEVGSLVSRLSTQGGAPPDPRNAPQSTAMLKAPQPAPEPQPQPQQPMPEPVPQEEVQLSQVLLPQQPPQLDLAALLQQAALEQQMQDSLLASLLLGGQQQMVV